MSTLVAKLREFGCDEVVTGGQTGVVGVIRGQSQSGKVGLRSDEDALPATSCTNRAREMLRSTLPCCSAAWHPP